MASRFICRAEKEIIRKLSAILFEIKDPRLNGGKFAISRVSLSADLSHLKVYFVINEIADTQAVMMRALKKAVPFLRRRLGQSVRLKRIPELHVYHDNTPERAADIESIIGYLHETGQLRDDEGGSVAGSLSGHEEPGGPGSGCVAPVDAGGDQAGTDGESAADGSVPAGAGSPEDEQDQAGPGEDEPSGDSAGDTAGPGRPA